VKRDPSDKAFTGFIEKHSADAPGAPLPREHDDPLIHELVVACLSWNAPRAGVAAAVDRVRETIVDYNELRVMIAEELAELLGPRYPLAEERAARLRSALNEVYRREHGLTLAHLREANKRDAKAYLDTLPGLPLYAINRVALVGCEVHAFPVDSVILGLFDAAGVIEEGTDEATLAGRLERAIRAGDAAGRFWGLEAAGMKPARKPTRKSTTRKAGTGKATTKKTAKKPAAKRSKKTA
jgi:endonuclease III